jgi:hypothetical protein
MRIHSVTSSSFSLTPPARPSSDRLVFTGTKYYYVETMSCCLKFVANRNPTYIRRRGIVGSDIRKAEQDAAKLSCVIRIRIHPAGSSDDIHLVVVI